MLRGYYTAAAGMLAAQRRQEMLANNLANVNTPGYKSDQGTVRAFPDLLIEKMGGNPVTSDRVMGDLNTGVYLQETIPTFTPGPLKETGVSTDVALVASQLPVDPKTNQSGALFFAVQMPDGSTRYTQNGHFNLDGQGHLTTSQGYLVLNSQNQPIQLDTDHFTMDSDGTLRENGQAVNQLQIAYAARPTQLVKDGDDLYSLNNGTGTLPTAQNSGLSSAFATKQGFLEQSNVSADQTMTDMMMAYRTFEANQKIMQTYDQSMDKTVNDVGKIG